MIDFSPLQGLGTVDFYFLRHGKSEGNMKELVQGRLDFPLSNAGKEQAALTGRWFIGKPIAGIFTTPLRRGKETAQILSTEANLPTPVELPTLIELNTGVFTGISLEEARAQFPAMHHQFQEQSWEAVEGAERIGQLQERALQTWNTLIGRVSDRSKDDTQHSKREHIGVIAVSHAGMLQWIVKATLGSTSWFPLLPMGDCGIYHFSVQGTVSRWSLLNYQVSGVLGSR